MSRQQDKNVIGLRYFLDGPISWIVYLGFVAVATTCGGCYVLLDNLSAEAARDYLEGAAKVVIFICWAAAFFVGMLAVAIRHPASDEGYQQWLASSPWTFGMPLPRGAVRLHLRDLLVCIVLTAMALPAIWLFDPFPWPVYVAPFGLMLSGAAVCLGFDNWKTGQHLHGYAMLAIPPIVGCLAPGWSAAAITPIACYVIALHGTRLALKQFPWEPHAGKPVGLGWPYSAMLHPPREFIVGRKQAAISGVLVALWLAWPAIWFEHFIGLADVESLDEKLMELGAAASIYATLVVGSLCCFRWLAYLRVMSSLLCLKERYFRRALVTPKHDMILATPLIAIFACAAVGFGLPLLTGISSLLSAAIGLGVGVYICYGEGPRVVDLHYTGIHELSLRNVSSSRTSLVMVNA